MAERRMFAKTIIDSDAFIDMPVSSQNLYFHLSMRADDDGFINSPKKIMRMVNASDDDLRILCSKNFVIPFETGIVVIKHWKLHNYLRNDRYKPTVYQGEKSQLDIKDNGVYTLGIPDGNQRYTQVSIGKDRLVEDSIISTVDKPPRNTFTKPTIDDVSEYCKQRGGKVNAQKWYDHYESNGWKVGKNSMKSWQACVRNWEQSTFTQNQTNNSNKLPTDYSYTGGLQSSNDPEFLRKLDEGVLF
jgi:hypothetical protein